MNGITRRAGRVWRVMVVLTLGAGLLAGTPMASRAQGDAPLDLAALILHSVDLNWLVDELDLVGTEGYPFGTSFSARHTTLGEAETDGMYAQGRGSLDLSGPGGDDVISILEDTGWIRTQDELMVLAKPGHEDDWELGVGVTIEEFADDDGAEEAFDLLADGDLLAEVTEAIVMEQFDAPSLSLDIPAAMWSVFSVRENSSGFLSLWAQFENRIVSVAFHDGTQTWPESDVMVTLLDLQLKRLVHAEHLHQPNLSQCAPRLGGDQVLDYHEEYDVLNGRSFAAAVGTSYDDLQDAQGSAASSGIVHSYMTDQSLGGSAVGADDGRVRLPA